MIKGVIFDLDGTILDSINTFWQAFNAGTVAFKLEPVSKESLMSLLNQGASLAQLLSDIYPVLRTESASSTIEGIMAEIKKQYLARVADNVRLTSGTQELFHLLKSKGLKIGIATSRAIPPDWQRRELRKLQVAHFVDAIATADRIPQKPAPDTIIECLKKLRLSPKECIFVGDSQADVIAGKAAGVRTVVVTTGVIPIGESPTESPDFILDSLHEFMDKLDFILGGC